MMSMNEGTARVNLKLLILWELSEKSMSGYDIIKGMKVQGKKAPSPGSLYPILHDLHNDNLVSLEEEGKKKIYSLTKKGRLFLKKMNDLHTKSVSQMMSQLGRIAKGDELSYYERMNSLSDTYKKEMFSDMDILGPLQDALIDVYELKDTKLRLEMRRILKEATLKIKKKVK